MSRILSGEVSIPASILSKWLQPKPLYRSARGYYIEGLTTIEEFRNQYCLRNNVVRYVSVAGSDTNNGLSEATAFRTIKKAIDSNATTIYIKAGIYDGTESDFSKVKFSTNFIGYGGEVYVGRILQPRTWKNNDHIFTAQEPYTSNITHIFSTESKEESGLQSALSKVATQADCKMTPYSFALESNILHVNYPGVDANSLQKKLFIPIGGVAAISNILANTYYFENITLVGNCEFKAQHGKVYFNHCRFHYSGGDQLSLQNLQESILFKCSLGNSLGDGVDYNKSFGIEIDCVLTHHGQFGSSNQNSTAHEGSRVIRVGGLYQYAQDSNIYDISGSHSLNAGCTVGGINRRFPNGTAPQANIVSGYESMVWLDGVKAGGGFGNQLALKKEGFQNKPIGQMFSFPLTEEAGSAYVTV